MDLMKITLYKALAFLSLKKDPLYYCLKFNLYTQFFIHTL